MVWDAGLNSRRTLPYFCLSFGGKDTESRDVDAAIGSQMRAMDEAETAFRELNFESSR